MRRIFLFILATHVLLASCGTGHPNQATAIPGTPTLVASPTAEGRPNYFHGTLNGFEFGDDTSLPLAELSSKCVRNPVKDGGAIEAASSTLDFDFDYLPSGAKLSYVAASLCLDDVFLINKKFDIEGVGFFQVRRTRGRAVFSADFFRDQLQEATIGGRAAVTAEQVIYLRDAESSWYLFGMGISMTELEKIAGGLRAK
jgi:hypothetical protein